jgi:hypothetical protein
MLSFLGDVSAVFVGVYLYNTFDDWRRMRRYHK